MRVNLLPAVPLARRYFPLWVGLILFILVSVSTGAGSLYYLQVKELKKLDTQIKEYLPQEGKIRAQLKEKEQFLQDHRAVLDYEKTVSRFRSENMDWDQAITAMESALTAEGRIFNIQVKENRLEAMAAFGSLDSVSYFQSQMKKNSAVQQFTIDSIEDAASVKEVKIQPVTAKVVRFHFLYRFPSSAGQPNIPGEGEGL